MSDVSTPPVPPASRRLGAGAWWWCAAIAAALLLTLSTSGSFAAFASSIAPGTDRAHSDTLAMRVTGADGRGVCSSTDGDAHHVNTNAATCAAVGDLGPRTLAPGRVNARSVVVTNTGTVSASGFTVAFGTCAQSAPTAASGTATDLCRHIALRVTATSGATTTTVLDATLAAATEHGAFALAALPAGGSVILTFSMQLDRTADNRYQGVTASQPITLQFAS